MTSSPTTEEFGRFLPLAEVGEILGLTVAEVHEMVLSGELPAIRVGGAGLWRVQSTVLEAYIAGKYEESRRMGLWAEANMASVIELSDGHHLGR